METLYGLLKIPLPDNPPLPVLSFHPDHSNTVQHILQSANISSDDFSLIHWRAEKKGMDLMECAEAVLDTRDAIVKTDNSITDASPRPFLLMTSLNEDPGKSRKVPFSFYAT